MEWYIKIWSPFSWLYGGIVWLRNWLYDQGVFKTQEYQMPIICIGNLSVGGTGKTPMVEFLIEHLSSSGKIAVLSRGYGRKSKGFHLANEESTVQELGDEPFQIHSKFKHISVAVDTNRRNGIALLKKMVAPDLILLDDAFQHRKVLPSISILLTAYGSLYTKDHYLPTGTLRDHKKQAKRAQIIVVTKCPEDLSEEEKTQLKRQLAPTQKQQLLFSSLAYDEELKGTSEDITLKMLASKDASLVTGIANPEPLVCYLKEKGYPLEHLAYRDHFFFQQKHIDLFNSRPWILTTEKDYTRLKDRVVKLAYIRIKHQFLGGGEKQLLTTIKEHIKPDS